MRVVVTSDTHIGPRRRGPLPAELLAACARADLILHGGDLVEPGVLDVLEAYAPVAAVLGNVDGWDLAERLPERRVVDAGGVRIGMIHDAGAERGRAQRLAALFPDCRVAVYGHSHLPVCERHGDLLVLNPGSPTERRRAPLRTFAELDVADDGAVEARIVQLGA